MTRFASWTIGVLMFATACGGGSEKSARELCEQATRAYCDKVFDCPEGEDRRADEGGTKAACVSQNLGTCPVAAPCPGTSEPNYHQDKAEQCAAQYQALTCSAFGATSNLAICDEICTP